MAATIYLHWTATGYDWIRPGHYHSIITGDGRVHRLHSYGVDLPAHTWGRNSNSVALACACMGGQPDPWSQPPSAVQLQGLCQETAAIARSWGWDADAISIATVMTHAEAASNRDGRIMHDNYGPMLWGGTGERWDLWQLERNGSHNGGEQLRERIRTLLKNAASTTAAQPARAASDASALSFKRASHMRVKGEELEVAIDEAGLSWARTADLLNRYDIPYSWDSEQQRVLIGSLDVAPTYRPDGIQASVGWPLFEMVLQSREAPVILRGILRPDTSDGTPRAWCRVLEFAEEFGISVQYTPFSLGELRGG